MRTIEPARSGAGVRLALIVSMYHDFVTGRLQAGALAGLAASGVAEDDVAIVKVPGAFEIPLAAAHAARSGRFDAIVCLGCLIRGATPHFDYIAASVAHGLTAAAVDTGVPMAFGVLTTNTVEEALERAADGPSNKGWEAASAALDMASIVGQLRGMAAPAGADPGKAPGGSAPEGKSGS